MMKIVRMLLLTPILLNAVTGKGQADVNTLVKKVSDRIDQVNDYEASGKMKTDVTFLKVPESSVKVYFKKPNRLKIKNEKGLSFVPKGAVSINLSSILNGNKYSIIDAGTDKIGNTQVRVVKLLPEDDNEVVFLSTL
jgi:outer membrane lipoprotein-sorting protein